MMKAFAPPRSASALGSAALVFTAPLAAMVPQPEPKASEESFKSLRFSPLVTHARQTHREVHRIGRIQSSSEGYERGSHCETQEVAKRHSGTPHIKL
jgi:hypothetical protein